MKKARIAEFIFMALAALAVRIELPPGSTVSLSDDTGKSWTQTGENDCSLLSARDKWNASLKRQGWTLKNEFTPVKSADQYFSVWRREGRRIILMLWRIDSGKSGFSWGDYSAANKEAKP